MSIVIRFNTIVVRKASIMDKYAAGLDGYQSLYLPENASFYYEDQHLIAHTSMSAFYGVHDRLASIGLIGHPDSALADYCLADQEHGIDPPCPWLEMRLIQGLPVCWLAAEASGYLVDFKSGRFVRRVTQEPCESCGSRLTLGSAAMAIHTRERLEGPLAFVDINRDSRDARYRVVCPACGFENVFDHSGNRAGDSHG